MPKQYAAIKSCLAFPGDAITALLESLQILPITHSAMPHALQLSPDHVFIRFCAHDFANAVKQSGVVAQRLDNTVSEIRFPHFRAAMDAQSKAILTRGHPAYGVPGHLGGHYAIEIMDSGDLYLRHRRISGGQVIGQISDQARLSLIDRAATLLHERDAAYARQLRAARASQAIQVVSQRTPSLASAHLC